MLRLHRRDVFICIAFSVVIHFLFVVLIGTQYEMGNDTFVKNLVSGRCETTPQSLPLTMMALTFIAEVLAMLYRVWPAVPWFDTMMVLFSVIALSTLSVTLVTIMQPWKSDAAERPRAFPVLLLLISFLLYYENLLLFEFLRISITLSVSVLLILFCCRLRTRQYIVLTGLLLLDDMFRLETFPYSLLLSLPVIPLCGMAVRPVILRLITPALLYLALFTVNNIPFSARDSQYLSFRPYQFVLLDYKVKTKKETPDNAADSLKLVMSKNFFLNDESLISPAFLSRYFYAQDKDPVKIIDYIRHTDYSMAAFEKKLNGIYAYYKLLLLFIPLYFLVCFIINKPFIPAAGAVLLFYVFFLYGVTLFMKMENRILYPCFIAFTLVMIAGSNHQKPIGNMPFVSIFLFMIPFCFAVTGRVRSIHNDILIQQGVETRMQKLYDKHPVTFVCDLHQFNYAGIKLFDHPIKKLPCISFDNALIFMNEEYKNDCRRQFGTTETPEIFKQIIQNNNDYVWIGDLNRLRLLQAYFSQIHGMDFGFYMSDEDSILSDREPGMPVMIFLQNKR